MLTGECLATVSSIVAYKYATRNSMLTGEYLATVISIVALN